MAICSNCGNAVPKLIFNYCLTCLSKFVNSNFNGAYWSIPAQPVNVYVRKWYSYSEQDYERIFRWLGRFGRFYEPPKPNGEMEQVVLNPPIIDSFDDDIFSELFFYADGVKYARPYAAYCIFKELKRRLEEYRFAQETIDRVLQPPKYIDTNKDTARMQQAWIERMKQKKKENR